MSEPLDPTTQVPPGSAPPASYPPPVGYAPPPPGYGPPSYPPPYAYPPKSQATNGMAIASLVLGVLWIYWIGSILALVFGYIALRQIKERNEGGRGLAIAGVVLGWVEIAFIPIIILVVFALGTSVKSNFHSTCEQFSQNGTTASVAPCS